MAKKDIKRFQCYWTETHSVIVEAKNKDEAIDKLHTGNYTNDESAEMEGSIEAIEIDPKNW